jgi:hypothetical protein
VVGKGKEINYLMADFHDMSMIGDLDCLECSELIAFWQAPSKKPGAE